MSDTATTGRNRGRTFFLGCATAAVLVVAVPTGGYWLWSRQAEQARIEAVAAQEVAAEEQFAPMLAALDDATKASEPSYDIDKTIRVIHEIDLAMQEKQSLEEYLRWAARQDYSGVAPEVLEKRKEVLDILMRLYAKQVEADDQAAMWEVTSELLLSTFSVVAVTGEASLVNPAAGLSVDREQATELLAEMKSDRARHKQLMRDITAIETELFDTLVDYGEVYYRYVEEWDQLAVLRDRAYLAAHNGDWDSALAAAELAIDKAPDEKEAHLLKAMAMIELDNRENAAEIQDLLAGYVEDHPESSAPAFLLLGVHQARLGQTSEAQLNLQQSAAYFPKQSDALTDMLNPYKMRSFLRKSREGSFIVELYKSTMLGAGYFSPDLQLAKTLFDQGNAEEGRQKVLDHFARRRTQKQWDFIVSDIAFCHDLLGPSFWQIFPEDTYLDLEASPGMMGSNLSLSITNRSERTLHNATLVLAIQFTDMYSGDYEVLPAEKTVPAVLAREETGFGSVEVAVDVNGTVKEVDDIVRTRAILVSDDAVTWVDTDEYRIAEDKAFREKKANAAAMAASPEEKPVVEHPLARRHPRFQGTVDALLEGANEVAQVEMESKYGADNLVVKLPRQLSILRPIFRLRYGETLYEATDNVITGDNIELRFQGVENFDADGAEAPDDVELLMASPFGDVVFSWKNNGDLTWRFEKSEKE
jgi:tetratricopeptide (TPR) repeat protein